MTNTGGTAAGWYHASGDPDGTHRYWDGAQWVGEPQPVNPAPASPAATFAAPAVGQTPPAFGAPGAGISAPPSGYQPYTPGTPASTPADYGQRVGAYVLDALFSLAVFVVAIILAVVAGAVSEGLGLVVVVVGYLAAIGVSIWNIYFRQGSTGQSLGKQQLNVKLLKDDTGQPPGAGMTFARYLVGGLLSAVTCGIYGILDILWPLWDADKKRLTDKIMKMSVVKA